MYVRAIDEKHGLQIRGSTGAEGKRRRLIVITLAKVEKRVGKT